MTLSFSDIRVLLQDSLPSDLVLSGNCIEDVNHHTLGQYKDSVDRSNSCHLHKKHPKLLNNRRKVSRKVHRSVAVSNAVELIKLVLLSPVRENEVLNQSAELLRQFSNDDLFAAFSYLSEKKFMVRDLFFFSILCHMVFWVCR